MDLIDKLKNISESIPKQIDNIETEEATKNAQKTTKKLHMNKNPYEIICCEKSRTIHQ